MENIDNKKGRLCVKWDEVRRNYPNSGVLVDVLCAYSEENKRILSDMLVLEESDSAHVLWNSYKEINLKYPNKELYILHTSKKQIEVEEQTFLRIYKYHKY